MIYSTMMFFNEVDLLRLKIEEEIRGGVDKIIVVEATRTFSNIPKPLYLRHAYLPSQVQVIEIDKELDMVPDHKNKLVPPLQREALQRNAALKDIELQDDDVIIHGDIDEIFPAEDISLIVDAARKHGWVNLIGDKFIYKINLWCNEPWWSGFAATGACMRDKTINHMRDNSQLSKKKIYTNAKHFSYLGSPEAISQKMKSFAHIHLNKDFLTNPDFIQQRIGQYVDPLNRKDIALVPVKLDDTFPKAMLSDKKWETWTEQPMMTLAEAKKHIPMTFGVDEDSRQPGLDEFYAVVDNPEITFPWRKLGT